MAPAHQHGGSRRRALRCLLPVTLALLAVLAAAPAWAQVGSLAVEQGQIKVRRGSDSHIYGATAKPVALLAGDVLHAGDDALGVISFGQGEQVRLYANSHFVMTEVSPSQMRFGLSVGKVFVNILARLRANRSAIRTPTAVIGVKGTELVAGTTGEQTFLLTVHGEVSLINDALPGVEELVRTDQVSTVTRFRPPAPPVTVSPAQRDRIVSEPSLSTFEELGVQGAAGGQEGLQQGQEAIERSADLTRDQPPIESGAGRLIFGIGGIEGVSQ